MSWVKQATQMLTGLSKPDAKVLPADSPLKDTLKDDLHVQPALEPAAQASTKEGVGALVDKAKDAVIDQGGTDIKAHDALVKTVSQFAGDAAAEAARTDLMAEVKAQDKRIARSFADTVQGDGGAASIVSVMRPVAHRGDEEDEEEEEEAEQPAATESDTTDGA